MNKALLPYDIYERHRKVSEFITESDTVLDVGGELNHLAQFKKTKKIVVANLTTGDVIVKRNKLPFPRNSFDVVCAIDVLEHIPRKKRDNFVKNLIEVASKKVVMSFPIGTEKHIAYESKMLDILKKKGLSVKYLEEHVKYGLPKLEEIKKLAPKFPKQIYYSGDISTNEHLFKLFLFDPRVKIVRRLIYICKVTFNLITNSLFYALLSNKKYSQNVNRAYLLILK